jgi:hypothetical protein
MLLQVITPGSLAISANSVSMMMHLVVSLRRALFNAAVDTGKKTNFERATRTPLIFRVPPSILGKEVMAR